MAAEDRNGQVSTDEECTDCTERERSFDTLTRGLANGSISRRKALRVLGASLVGSVLAAIPGVALAKPPLGTCLKEGKPCQTNTDCCSQKCETRKGKLVCGPAVQCTGSGPGNCVQPESECLQVLCSESGFCGAVQAKPDGTGCNANNPCTVNDKCQAGVCTPGGPRNCDDDDVCTLDTCDPETGCANTEIPGCCRNDSECEDDNPCTTNTCEGDIAAGEGVCVSRGVTGCCRTDADCNDNNACTTETCDQTTNTCVFTPVVCEDNDVCTTNTCDPATGCVHTEIPGCCRNDNECDDDNACTTDTCEGDIAAGEGVCVFTPIVCEDNDVCTTNTCNPQTGCVHTEIPGCCRNDNECDDDNACTTDTCEGDIAAGEGVCVSTPVVCADNDVCTVTTCDPATGCVHTEIPGCCRNDNECDDNNPCTTNTCEGDIAAGEGVCVSAGVPGCCRTDADCNDNNACTTDTCDQTTNTCVFTPIVCEEDNDVCTLTTCDPETGCVHTEIPGCCRNNAECQDNNACTTNTCEGDIAAGEGVCVSTPVVCNDNNPCTVDTCDPAEGCVHTEIPGCIECQNAGQCPTPSNQCQRATCTGGVCGVENKPNGTGCNDNLGCTSTDVCTEGVCAGTSTCTSGQNTQCCAAGTTNAGECKRATGASCGNSGQCCNACVSGVCT